MFKKYLLVMGVIAVFLLGGCQLYEDIYGKSDVSTISLEDIVVEEESPVEIFDPGEGEAPDEVEVIEIEAPDEEEGVSVVQETAVVIIVEETDLIDLEPDATDPDGDPLTYSFTSPLDSIGDWQTTYGDAGEYTVTITASDGDLSASQDVLILVNRKEESPTINSAVPEETTLTIREDNVIEFRVSASDLNDDELTYTWLVDGEEVSSDTSYTLELGFESAGSHTVKIGITDGLLETSEIWAIAVENVNREPEMGEIENIVLRETEPVVIVVEGSDPDGDDLTYIVDNENFAQEGNVFTWDTTYDNSGSYDITITVTDGDRSVSQQINIVVENVNRAPVFLGIEQR